MPRGIMEPSKCAPQNYGVFKVRPAEFWSNALCAPLSHGDIVTGRGGQDQFFENKAIGGEFLARNGKLYGIRGEFSAKNGKLYEFEASFWREKGNNTIQDT